MRLCRGKKAHARAALKQRKINKYTPQEGILKNLGSWDRKGTMECAGPRSAVKNRRKTSGSGTQEYLNGLNSGEFGFKRFKRDYAMRTPALLQKCTAN